MQVLTPTGYKNIEDVNIGDELVAYDINTGVQILNILEGKQKWTYDMYPPTYDENGNVISTSEEIFQNAYGDWTFYLINNTWTLYKSQSVWANDRVVHASELQVGGVVYNDQDQPITITDIQVSTAAEWWRLDVSGDHSYIADNIILHNANRYWVGGGSSANWNATGNTNWGSASGTQDNASVPTSADAVIFDGAGIGGNTNSTISATITILSYLVTSGYNATTTFNAALTVLGSVTFGANMTLAGSSSLTMQTNSGTLTSNGKIFGGSFSIQGLANITVTLLGNMSILGGLSTSNQIDPSITRTTTETITCFGLSCGRSLQGTADIIIKGGSIFTAGANLPCYHSIAIDGNVTFISGLYLGGQANTFSYVSGVISGASTNQLGMSLTTYNVPSLTWASVKLDGSATLQQSIVTTGLLQSTAGGGGNSLNTSNGSTLTCAGIQNIGNNPLNGTVVVTVTGGSLSCTVNNASSTVGLPIIIAGNVSIGSSFVVGGGSITYSSGTVTTTNSTLFIQGNETLNTSGITWNNITAQGNTSTLTSNLSMTGLFTVATSTHTINTSNSSTWTASGGITLSSAALSGTAKVVLTGGTWSASGIFTISNSIDINGNCTISGNVYYNSGTMTYVSGTVTTTGSTMNIRGGTTATINTNGITWNNFGLTGGLAGGSMTISSNQTINGTLFLDSLSGGFSRTGSQTVTVAGGVSGGYGVGTTVEIFVTGGSMSGSLSGTYYLNGNVTLANGLGIFGGSSLFRYLSGTITCVGTTTFSAGTFDVAQVLFNNVDTPSSGGFPTITLAADVNVAGTFTNQYFVTWSTSVGARINVFGRLVSTNNAMSGNVPVYMKDGSTIVGGNGSIAVNLFIDGLVTFNGTLNKNGAGLVFLRGKLNANVNANLNIVSSSTVLGFDKVQLPRVTITAGATVTMDRFFSGTPSKVCNITSTGANYTIAFQDNFEKIGRYVSLSGATLSRPMQLLITNNTRFNTNRGTNGLGVRYNNQSPNGFAKNSPSIADTMTVPALGLEADPCFLTQG